MQEVTQIFEEKKILNLSDFYGLEFMMIFLHFILRFASKTTEIDSKLFKRLIELSIV